MTKHRTRGQEIQALLAVAIQVKTKTVRDLMLYDGKREAKMHQIHRHFFTTPAVYRSN